MLPVPINQECLELIQTAVHSPAAGEATPRLVLMAEACVLLRCGRATLKAAATAGHLRVIRRGRHLFIPDQDLARWIDSGMPVK